jgi:hypothetical protein
MILENNCRGSSGPSRIETDPNHPTNTDSCFDITYLYSGILFLFWTQQYE